MFMTFKFPDKLAIRQKGDFGTKKSCNDERLATKHYLNLFNVFTAKLFSWGWWVIHLSENIENKNYVVEIDVFSYLEGTVRPKIGPVYHSEINCMIYNQKLFD